MCVCVYIYTYICIHIYIFTYIHIHLYISIDESLWPFLPIAAGAMSPTVAWVVVAVSGIYYRRVYVYIYIYIHI